MERPMTHELRNKINIAIKNKIDISDLIRDVSIKGEDLSNAIISDIYRIDTDISGCNFSGAIIGSSTKVATFIRCMMQNVNFESTNFIDKAWIRHCDAQNCNFKNANVSLVDYRDTNFDGSTFCNAIIRIGTACGIGCKFPKQMFYDLCKNWKMKITVTDV